MQKLKKTAQNVDTDDNKKFLETFKRSILTLYKFQTT